MLNQVEKGAEEEKALRTATSEERDSLQKEVLALKMETQKKDIHLEELQKEVCHAALLDSYSKYHYYLVFLMLDSKDLANIKFILCDKFQFALVRFQF